MSDEKLTSGPRGPWAINGRHKVVTGTIRDRVWRMLRIRRKVSVPEVIGLLSDASDSADAYDRMKSNVQKYLRALNRAGYLVPMRKEPGTALTSNGHNRYMLVRDTGPVAPIMRAREVFDPNEGRSYELA